MFQPAIDPDKLSSHDSELTPIFHAMVSRAPDPAEHFAQDPLSAPIPVTPASPLAMARMLLSAVPVARLESGGHEPSYRRPGGARPSQGASSGGRHQIREIRSMHGGRHRALRSVGLGAAD